MNTKTRQISLCLAVAVALAVPLAGCGGDDNSSDSTDTASTSSKSYGTQPSGDTQSAGGSGGGSRTLRLAADPNGAIAYDKTSLTAKAGKSTIDFENASSVPHAVEVEGNGVEEETDTIVGGKAKLALDLKPGTYEFYCPIDDHKEEGMKGVLTVK
ncbi:MAG TPA: cupredoxin domain-containing protein [Solirubrobacterales bacterium]|nr:cupredoxin domain-containing protein [Solirubrobacterales bacterium]